VLTVFTYAITFGFAINLPVSLRTKVPLWMDRIAWIGWRTDAAQPMPLV